MLAEDFVTEAPFNLPEAKTRASYKSRDVLLVGSAFEDDKEGSLTDSGYPRTVREWERGTPISEAKTVFEGEKTDVAVNVSSMGCINLPLCGGFSQHRRFVFPLRIGIHR